MPEAEVKKIAPFNLNFDMLDTIANMTPEEQVAYDARVEAEEKKFIAMQRESVYRACGFGAEYDDVNMDMFKTKGKEVFLQAARKFYGSVIHNEIVNMFLSGNCGTGKTTLVAAIMKELVHTVKNKMYDVEVYYSCKYITSRNLCMKLHQSEGFNADESRESIVRSMINCDVLAIDEVGKATTDKEPAYLFDVIDARYRAKRPTIIISNQSFNELHEFLGAASMSRLMNNNALITLNTFGMEDMRVKTA